MAKSLVKGLVLVFLLNTFMVEQSEAGKVKAAKKGYESVFGSVLAANDAVRKSLALEANAKDTDSEKASNLKEQSMILYQGDIVLDPYTYKLIKASKINRAKRNAHRSRSSLWTSRTIPYFIPSKMGNVWCSSMIGKMYFKAGKQRVSIGKNCEQPGTILHELVHAIGFWHEQSRPDRDKYVRINYENIASGFSDQFDKFDWQTIDDLGKDYDFKSIMHYDRFAYSKNQLPTIEAIHDPNLKFGNQKKRLSESDVIEINALYDCNTNYHGWTAWSPFTPCDKNCMKTRQRYCYHPKNDYTQCVGANPYGIQKEQQRCTKCPVPIDGHWGKWGPWTPCSATCDDGGSKRTRQCNNPAPAHGGKSCPGSNEEDKLCMVKRCILDADDTDFEDNRMGIWTNSKQDNFDWTLLKGHTQTMDTGPLHDHTSGKGYYLYTESSAPRVKGDKAILSTRWLPYVPGGQCVKFAYHMFGKETGSLGLKLELHGRDTKYYIFYKKESQGNEWKRGVGRIDPPASVGYRLSFEAVLGGTGYSDMAIDDVYIDPGHCDCQDDYVSCKKWAASGECSKNADWMAKHCKRSCQKCTKVIPTSMFSEIQTVPLCSDKDPFQCPLWADRGECTANPVYMNKNCAKSCGICGCKDSDPVQCPLWAAKGICKNNPAFMLVKCIKSCNVCRCHDKVISCLLWASKGECTKNPKYMKSNCRRSCKVCK
ncbi:uncharacterized protein LOC116300825 [Actinia tenebrosa]|uniref:Metalloendopeptidase n=1 Tax=Actinia tenebrosa TaxID=6105 RepID=A0A6P8IG11_ACTTE|nr:uncharacterized protein LOC116300825 [Actinia tenebrosa]